MSNGDGGLGKHGQRSAGDGEGRRLLRSLALWLRDRNHVVPVAVDQCYTAARHVL